MKAVIPMLWVDKIRLYVALFQLTRILTEADDKFNLTFNACIVLTCIALHMMCITKVLLRHLSGKIKTAYYISNVLVLFFGMIHKFVGFEKFWEMKKVILMNFILMTIAFAVIGCAFNAIE